MADEASAGGSPGLTGRRPSLQSVHAHPGSRLAAVVLLTLAVLASWWGYDRWRRGVVLLVTTATPVTVEVFDESGEVPVVEPIDVITDAVLSLPDGDYQMRVSGRGRLSQTYRVAVNCGETVEQLLSLDEGLGADTSWKEPEPNARRKPPFDLGAEPVRPLQYADLDGDGKPELLALLESSSGGLPVLSAFALATRKLLWSIPMTEPFLENDAADAPTAWPWLSQLDTDGSTMVLVPDAGPMPRGPGYRGVRRIDGRTGRTLWTRPLRPHAGQYDGPTRFLEAPDLDDDGVGDVILVWCEQWNIGPMFRNRENVRRLHVDALSGKDGHTLWSWNRRIPFWTDCSPGVPGWWGRGPDGWPLLAVPLEGDFDHSVWPGRVNAPPPVVHVLEASTGRERHIIPGMTRCSPVDLDGDGLVDLRGEADEKVVAIRGTAPEAWRAPADFAAVSSSSTNPAAGDLDGDGVGDVVGISPEPPGMDGIRPTTTRTVVARSGADGRLIWKSRLGSPWSWLQSDGNEEYSGSPSALPDADLDGDGMPEILISRYAPATPMNRLDGATVLNLRVLSGRTGRALWSAGPLPRDSSRGVARLESFIPPVGLAVTSGRRPDLIVSYLFDANPAVPGPGVRLSYYETRLARISGQDGRVVWDIVRFHRNVVPGATYLYGLPPKPVLVDLDGDGSPEMLLAPPPKLDAQMPLELKAIALADGHSLWTQTIDGTFQDLQGPPVVVGDLDGDGRAEVVVRDRSRKVPQETQLRLLDGRDGRTLWSLEPSSEAWFGSRSLPSFCLAGVTGDGRKAIAALLRRQDEDDLLVLVDQRRREIARTNLPIMKEGKLQAIDLTGDGKDELIVSSATEFRVLGSDLKLLWSERLPADVWCRPEPARGNRPGVVLMSTHVERNGADGRPLAIRPFLGTGRNDTWRLDEGNSGLSSLWLGSTLAASFCRRSLPVGDDGKVASQRGSPTPPGRAPTDDPRWRRPLPWAIPVAEWIGWRGLIAMIALAFLNLAVPLGLLRLAARRRPWTIRLLLVLPLAAALPLYALHNFEPLMTDRIASTPVSPRKLYLVATIAGAPFVVFAGLASWSLVRLRWRRLLVTAVLLAVSSAVVAAAWIAYDIRTMPPPGHYDRSEWPLVLIPGMAVAGSILTLSWILRRPVRWLMKPRRTASAP